MRLVSKGYVQRQGVDYDETFAPVVPFSVVLLVLGRFISKGLHVHHADISTAFLIGNIDGELSVEWNTITYRLLKSMYGLNQLPRPWYKTLKKSLQLFGSIQLESCECVFKIKKDIFEVIFMVHVDGIIILSGAIVGINRAKAELKSLFNLTDLGPLQYYLGVSFQRTGNSILLSQRGYVRNIFNQFGMESAKTAQTPMVEDIEDFLVENNAEWLDENRYPYRSPVGSLLYLSTHARPDISFAVEILSRFVANHSILH